jgi:hypothetical protein
VSQKGDTIPIVREVTITREGIRIQRTGEIIERRIRDRVRRRLDITFDSDDSTRHEIIDEGQRSGEIVSFFQNVHVPKGRTVDGEVVAICGNVRIEGRVESDVVAVCGSVDLADSAHVGGDVVAVGGVVRGATSSEVQGETLSLPVCGSPHWAPWLAAVAGGISLVLFLILGAMVALLFPERLGRVAATVSRRTFLSLVVGVLSIPLLPIVFLLLCITVIGIPVALLLLFLYPVAAFVGYVASCALLGARFLGRPVTQPPIWTAALLGLAFVGFFFLASAGFGTAPGHLGVLHVVSWVLLGVGAVIGSVSVLLGLGALFLSRIGEPERGPGPREGVAPMGGITPGSGPTLGSMPSPGSRPTTA